MDVSAADAISELRASVFSAGETLAGCPLAACACLSVSLPCRGRTLRWPASCLRSRESSTRTSIALQHVVGRAFEDARSWTSAHRSLASPSGTLAESANGSRCGSGPEAKWSAAAAVLRMVKTGHSPVAGSANLDVVDHQPPAHIAPPGE